VVHRVRPIHDQSFTPLDGDKLVEVDAEFQNWHDGLSVDEVYAFNGLTDNHTDQGILLDARRTNGNGRSHANRDPASEDPVVDQSPRFLLVFSVPTSWHALKLGYAKSCGWPTPVPTPIDENRQDAPAGNRDN
jgi:hypothetical protein